MKRLYRKLALHYSEGGIGQVLQRSIVHLLHTLYSETHWNIYIHNAADNCVPSDLLFQCRKLTYEDLLKLRYYKVIAFPEEVRLRFDNNNTCYGFYTGGNLATIGWSSDGYLELDRGVIFPCASEAALFDFLTLPEFRSRGLYTNALRYLIEDKHKSGVGSVYIAVDADNAFSVKGIQAAGFRLHMYFRRRKIFGVTFNVSSPAHPRILEGK
jgi:GNAT superfamily N-acetyltransferase